MGASFNGKAYEEIYKHGTWKVAADMYEERFAAKLYKTPYVQQAAKTALTKLSKMLNAYYNDQGSVRNLDEKTVLDAETTQQAAARIVGQPAAVPAQIFGRPAAAAAQIVRRPAAAPAQMFGRPAAAPVEIAGELTRGPGDVQQADAQPADGGNDNVEITKTLIDALLPKGDSSGGAGQIGNYSEAAQNGSEEERRAARQRDEENLDAVINGDGNLRERMTLLYNGMFVNGGRKKEDIAISHSLKNMMLHITENQRESIPELQGVRIDLLEEMEQRKKEGDVFDTYSIARDLKKASDKKQGRGNLLTRFFQGIHRAWVAAISSKFTRKTRSEKDREDNRLGEAHYNKLGLELSKREKANGMKEGKLQWQEGRAWYEMRKQVNAEGMLQTAGPSGTTLRMLGAYKLMGASLKELLYFRLALIAWMVTSKDHSLYEIMTGSQNAGVTGNEDLSEPATMYMTVDPIPVEVLRNEFAPNRQFPHEMVYRVMLNELRDERRNNAEKKNISFWKYKNYSLFEPDFFRATRAYRKKFMREDAKNAEAQELALNIYTTGAFLAMNRGQKYGSIIAKHSLIDDANATDHGVYGNAFSGELKDSKIKKSIFKMIRISSRMSQDALEERGQLKEQAYGGDGDQTESVYRGQRLTSDLRAGENAEITLRSLTSSSKDIERATEFYTGSQKKEGADNAVLVEYKMHGKGAVDISGVSSYIGEAEVLIPANTKFRIVKPLRKAGVTLTKILWDQPEEADREEKQYSEAAYGYVICLEEVEGPGSAKREERGELADLRREIREDYNQRLQELRRQQEQQEQQEPPQLLEEEEEEEQKDEIWEVLMNGRR